MPAGQQNVGCRRRVCHIEMRLMSRLLAITRQRRVYRRLRKMPAFQPHRFRLARWRWSYGECRRRRQIRLARYFAAMRMLPDDAPKILRFDFAAPVGTITIKAALFRAIFRGKMFSIEPRLTDAADVVMAITCLRALGRRLHRRDRQLLYLRFPSRDLYRLT